MLMLFIVQKINPNLRSYSLLYVRVLDVRFLVTRKGLVVVLPAPMAVEAWKAGGWWGPLFSTPCAPEHRLLKAPAAPVVVLAS